MFKKRISKQRLDTLFVNYVDKSRTSPRYFTISYFPRYFSGGKNYIGISGDSERLVPDSKIHCEIIDRAGNPIYHEILNYVHGDGSRAIVAYIYPDTAYGAATVYLAGRARDIPERRAYNIPFSNNPADDNFKDNPNVKWRRRVWVNPNASNFQRLAFISSSTETDGFPTVQVSELNKPHLETNYPSGSLHVDKQGFSNQTLELKAIPGVTGIQRPAVYYQNRNWIPYSKNHLGKTGIKFTPDSSLLVGSLAARFNAASLTPLTVTSSNSAQHARRVALSQLPIEVDDIRTQPKLHAAGFKFEPDMVGGQVVFNNMSIRSKNNAGITQLTESFTCKILKIQNEEIATVDRPFAFQFSEDGEERIVNSFLPTSNFTMSYNGKPTFVATENSRSYANINILNMKPVTGDVYKVRVYRKQKGAIGSPEFITEQRLQQQDILIDENSIIVDQGIGIIESQREVKEYWRGSGKNVPDPSLKYNRSQVMNSLRIKADGAGDRDDALLAYYPLDRASFVPGIPHRPTSHYQMTMFDDEGNHVDKNDPDAYGVYDQMVPIKSGEATERSTFNRLQARPSAPSFLIGTDNVPNGSPFNSPSRFEFREGSNCLLINSTANSYFGNRTGPDINTTPTAHRLLSGSLGIWFNVNNPAGSRGRQVLVENGGQTSGINMYISQSRIWANFYTTANVDRVHSKAHRAIIDHPIQGNRWYHAGYTFFPGRLEPLFRDGFGGHSGSMSASAAVQDGVDYIIPAGGSDASKLSTAPNGKNVFIGTNWFANSTTRARVVRGALHMSSSNTDEVWRGELRSKQTFARQLDGTFNENQADHLELLADITFVTQSYGTDGGTDHHLPRMMIGFGDATNPTASVGNQPTATYYNMPFAIYASDDRLHVYEKRNSVASLTNNTAGTKLDGSDPNSGPTRWRLAITPNTGSSQGGARYRGWKFPDLQSPVFDYNSSGSSKNADYADTDERKNVTNLDVSITCLSHVPTFHVNNVQVHRPGAVFQLYVDGHKVGEDNAYEVKYPDVINGGLDNGQVFSGLGAVGSIRDDSAFYDHRDDFVSIPTEDLGTDLGSRGTFFTGSISDLKVWWNAAIMGEQAWKALGNPSRHGYSFFRDLSENNNHSMDHFFGAVGARIGIDSGSYFLNDGGRHESHTYPANGTIPSLSGSIAMVSGSEQEANGLPKGMSIADFHSGVVRIPLSQSLEANVDYTFAWWMHKDGTATTQCVFNMHDASGDNNLGFFVDTRQATMENSIRMHNNVAGGNFFDDIEVTQSLGVPLIQQFRNSDWSATANNLTDEVPTNSATGHVVNGQVSPLHWGYSSAGITGSLSASAGIVLETVSPAGTFPAIFQQVGPFKKGVKYRLRYTVIANDNNNEGARGNINKAFIYGGPGGVNGYRPFGNVPIVTGSGGTQHTEEQIFTFDPANNNGSEFGEFRFEFAGADNRAGTSTMHIANVELAELPFEFTQQYHHLAVSCEQGQNPKLFVDGQFIDEFKLNTATDGGGTAGSFNSSEFEQIETVIIGGDYDSNINSSIPKTFADQHPVKVTNQFNGKIGQLRIYKRALNAEEIGVLASNPLSKVTGPESYVQATVTGSMTRLLSKGSDYYLQFDAKCFDDENMKMDEIPNPRIDVYMSGSGFTPKATFSTAAPFHFVDDIKLGKFIGTVEGSSGSRFDDVQLHFQPDELGNGLPIFVVRRGEWYLSEIRLLPSKHQGFNVNQYQLIIPIKPHHINTEQDYFIRYYNRRGRVAQHETRVEGITFTGENTYIQGGFNLLTGSMFINSALHGGILMSGQSSGFIKTFGYKGFDSASLNDNSTSGFMIWSGSADLTEEDGTTYTGTGIEIVSNANQYLKFSASKDDSTIDVKTPQFLFGSGSDAFISGSGDGKIYISSSRFELPADDTMIVKEKMRLKGLDFTFTGSKDAKIYFSQSAGVGRVGINTDNPETEFDARATEFRFQKKGEQKGLRINEFGDIESFNRDAASSATGSEFVLSYQPAGAAALTINQVAEAAAAAIGQPAIETTETINDIFGGDTVEYLNSLDPRTRELILATADKLGFFGGANAGDTIGSLRYIVNSGSSFDSDSSDADFNQRTSGEAASITTLVASVNDDGSVRGKMQLKVAKDVSLSSLTYLELDGISGNTIVSRSLVFANNADINMNGNDITNVGTIQAQTFHTDIVSSSISFSSGSNRFGDASNDTHTFIGNITASGDISASGDLTARTITATGNIFGDEQTAVLGMKQLITNQFVSSSQLISSGHITASGNISGSGRVITSIITAGAGTVAGSNILTVGNLNSIASDALLESTVGTSLVAQQANTIRSTTNAEFVPVIVDSVNATATAESLRTPTTGFTFNPSTSVTTIGTLANVNTTHVTASGNISASGTITANNYNNIQHVLKCQSFYINDNPFIQNSLYFGGTLNHQPNNWNDPQAIGGDPNTTTTFDISDDDQNWGMCLPFDVSRIEVQSAARPGLGGGDNFTAALYTASRITGNVTSITLGLATASSVTFDGSGRYTNNDIDYIPVTTIPKGTMLYFGIGTNTSGPTAKNARGYHTILITKAN